MVYTASEQVLMVYISVLLLACTILYLFLVVEAVKVDKLKEFLYKRNLTNAYLKWSRRD